MLKLNKVLEEFKTLLRRFLISKPKAKTKNKIKMRKANRLVKTMMVTWKKMKMMMITTKTVKTRLLLSGMKETSQILKA